MEIAGRVMSTSTSIRVSVSDRSQVSEARRMATAFARQAGLADAKLAKVALVATEAATNLVKHASRGGELLIQHLDSPGGKGIEMLALDSGPGIANAGRALGDGYSTVGTPGTGLGAIRRQSDYFDLYTRPGRGTALMVRFWPDIQRSTGSPSLLEVGSVRVPRQGESVCGDDWAVGQTGGRSLALVVDGLGHGLFAAEAAATAVSCFNDNLQLEPEELMGALDAALRHTRGGVAAVVQISASRETLSFVGVGNISGFVCLPEGHRSMVSQPGTVGQELRKINRFDYPWSPDALLVLHSDGLSSRTDTKSHPGLLSRSASLIAGVLYREYKRGRDDALVLALRESRT
jgi:anti-sigma regulatory factor (Ser/Thr protein kinase)